MRGGAISAFARLRFARLIGAYLVALAPGTALAKDPIFSVSWMVVPQSLPTKQLTLTPDQSEPLFRIVPKSIYRLPVDAVPQKGKTLIPAGTYLAAVDDVPGMVCEPTRRRGNESFFCLVDTDGDGRFDACRRLPSKEISYGRRGMVIRKSEYLFSMATPLAPETREQPIAIDRWQSGDGFSPLAVELVFDSRFALQSANRFAICISRSDLKDVWGGTIPTRVCLPQITEVKDRDLPVEQNFLGTKVRFLSVAGKALQAEIEYRSSGGEFR